MLISMLDSRESGTALLPRCVTRYVRFNFVGILGRFEIVDLSVLRTTSFLRATHVPVERPYPFWFNGSCPRRNMFDDMR